MEEAPSYSKLIFASFLNFIWIYNQEYLLIPMSGVIGFPIKLAMPYEYRYNFSSSANVIFWQVIIFIFVIG